MGWLFNSAYLLALLLTSPRWVWRYLRRQKYGNGWREKLLGAVPPRLSPSPCLWAHGVSVGEVVLLEPFLRRFEQNYPQWECVVSTTTFTGYQVAQARLAPRKIFYCPLDFTWAVRTAFERICPSVLVLAELEIWPNLIREAWRRGIPVAVINGRLSDRSFHGYRRLRCLLRPTFQRLAAVAAQDPLYAERFHTLGCPLDAVRVTGSLKFDGLMGDRENEATRRFAKLWQVRSTDVVWVAGSTQAPEEQIVLDVFAKLAPQYPQLRCIIVPRHPERFNQVAVLLGETGLPWIRRSELPEQGAFSRLLLVDTVGELRYWWGLADVAFVGGSFGTRGGQNMLEPAAYGAAVCFGPHTFNFRDVVRLLLSHHGAVVVRSPGELEQFVRLAIDSPPWRYQLGERARQLVRAQQGATQATLEFLQQRIDRLKPAQSEAA